VRVGAPGGDGSLVPGGRAYTLQVLIARPTRALVDGAELAELAGPEQAGAGWWHDGTFAPVRTGARSPTVRVEAGQPGG
jgi:hypothetical protein